LLVGAAPSYSPGYPVPLLSPYGIPDAPDD